MATEGTKQEWRQAARYLNQQDGKTWLQIDDVARAYSYMGDVPVSGTRGWLSESIGESTGFVAAITSLHADGRIRQRATEFLARGAGRLPAAALALRTIDHVPEVRAEALQGLQRFVTADGAEVLLEVLLAARSRHHAPAALESVRVLLLNQGETAILVERLMASADRNVRRWAFDVAHEHRILTVDQLSAAAASDRDQLVRANCARWLVDVASSADLRALLRARSVDARYAALAHIADEDLTDDDVRRLLVDRSPRVREMARGRAQRRNWDPAETYRTVLSGSASPTVITACLDGLAETGDAADTHVFVEALDDFRAGVRAAGVLGVGRHATQERAIELLQPMLLDTSPRVSKMAARVLARVGAGARHAVRAWDSSQPWSRRAAWMLTRSSGAWNRVEADLRAAADDDVDLSFAGRTGIRNWLHAGAATTWARLADEQRVRLGQLLTDSQIDDKSRRVVAFHAGIPIDAPPLSSDDRADSDDTSRRPGRHLLRLLRRR